MEIIVDETTDKLLIEAQQVKNILEQFSMDNQTFREDADSQVETFIEDTYYYLNGFNYGSIKNTTYHSRKWKNLLKMNT